MIRRKMNDMAQGIGVEGKNPNQFAYSAID